MNEQNQRDSIMSMARGAFEERVDYEMVPQVPGQMNMDGTQQEAPKLLKLIQHA